MERRQTHKVKPFMQDKFGTKLNCDERQYANEIYANTEIYCSMQLKLDDKMRDRNLSLI